LFVSFCVTQSYNSFLVTFFSYASLGTSSSGITPYLETPFGAEGSPFFNYAFSLKTSFQSSFSRWEGLATPSPAGHASFPVICRNRPLFEPITLSLLFSPSWMSGPFLPLTEIWGPLQNVFVSSRNAVFLNDVWFLIQELGDSFPPIVHPYFPPPPETKTLD